MRVPLIAAVLPVFKVAGPPITAGLGPRWRTPSIEEEEDGSVFGGRTAIALLPGLFWTSPSLVTPSFVAVSDLFGRFGLRGFPRVRRPWVIENRFERFELTMLA